MMFIAFFILLLLKIFGVVSISWWIVFLPLLIGLAFVVFFGGIAAVGAGLLAWLDK